MAAIDVLPWQHSTYDLPCDRVFWPFPRHGDLAIGVVRGQVVVCSVKPGDRHLLPAHGVFNRLPDVVLVLTKGQTHRSLFFTLNKTINVINIMNNYLPKRRRVIP